MIIANFCDNIRMEMRHLTPDDIADHTKLMAEAFGRGARNSEPRSTDELWLNKYALSNTIGVFEESRLVAAATIHNIALRWDCGLVPMGGVAGVACAAQRRGNGHVGRMLKQALIEMKNAGQNVSGLFPFSFSFYRRYGWEWVGERRITTLPFSILPAREESRSVRMYEGLDAKQVASAVYEAASKRYRGMIARDETRSPDFWAKALDHRDGRTAYVHVYHAPENDRPEGYFVFRYPTSGDTVTVSEFFAATTRAHRGLLGVLHNYGTQLKSLELHHPMDDALPICVMDWSMEFKTRPVFMGRLVDVANALKALDAQAAISGSMVLAVSDEMCDWNDRTFKISIDNGRVHIAPSTSAPDVSIDIQALSQAYWGWPSLHSLRTAERLQAHNETGFTLLAELLPQAFVYFADFF